MKNIVKEVAKAHKMSEQEARKEMSVAIREAMKAQTLRHRHFGNRLPPMGKNLRWKRSLLLSP